MRRGDIFIKYCYGCGKRCKHIIRRKWFELFYGIRYNIECLECGKFEEGVSS